MVIFCHFFGKSKSTAYNCWVYRVYNHEYVRMILMGIWNRKDETQNFHVFSFDTTLPRAPINADDDATEQPTIAELKVYSGQTWVMRIELNPVNWKESIVCEMKRLRIILRDFIYGALPKFLSDSTTPSQYSTRVPQWTYGMYDWQSSNQRYGRRIESIDKNRLFRFVDYLFWPEICRWLEVPHW